MLIIYLAVVSAALYFVSKILLPELAKPPLSGKKTVPAKSVAVSPSAESDYRVRRLKTILSEKNRNIQLLQKEVKIFHIQVRDFDKVKSLLEDEIHRLREQNRIFRSELGLPTTVEQIKQKSYV